MLPSWDDKYKTDYERVDRQHKKLFDLAAHAYLMNAKLVSKEEIKEVLFEFFEYMKVHFKDEEEYMAAIGYPNLDEHKEIHQFIINSLVRLIKEIHDVHDMKKKLSIIAKNWLVDHIIKEDMKIAKWRKIQEKAGKKLNVVEEQKYYYVCGCHDNVHQVSPEVHKKIQNGAKFFCKKCKEVLKFQEY